MNVQVGVQVNVYTGVKSVRVGVLLSVQLLYININKHNKQTEGETGKMPTHHVVFLILF